MSLFEIKNVSKSFGDLKVLNDISVSVKPGTNEEEEARRLCGASDGTGEGIFCLL